MRRLGKTAAIVLLVAILPTIFVVKQLAATGLSWADMDWDESGRTSFNEFWFGMLDVGVRNATVDGKSCRDVYARKDGLPVRLLCP